MSSRYLTFWDIASLYGFEAAEEVELMRRGAAINLMYNHPWEGPAPVVEDEIKVEKGEER